MTGTTTQSRPVGEVELPARFLLPGDPPNLCTRISCDDGMYDPTAQKHYFNVGRSALACVRSALQATNRPDPKAILDLPCGHGRVLRFLHAAYPTAQFTACDLLRDGVDFCAQTFGAEPCYSSEDVTKINLPHRFDVVWCGSLMTHLVAARWGEFLRLFARALNPGGVCLFSTHGQWVADGVRDRNWRYGIPDHEGMLADWEATGFGHRPYADQSEYGVSLSSEQWIRRQIRRVPELRWIAHYPRGWDEHHDVVVVQRRNRWLKLWPW